MNRFFKSNEHAAMAVLAAVVGLAGGVAAVGFHHLISFIQLYAYGAQDNLLQLIHFIPWYLGIGIPALGGLIVGPLTYFLAKEAKGHGVPEVIEAVALKNGMIRKRIAGLKFVTSAVSIGTGSSLGRIGPVVQIGSALGSVTGQILNISVDRIRTLVCCGASAGIAATFNAPIAGSMFAMEIVLGYFGLATFSPIIIASVAATAVSRYFLGDAPAFIVPTYELASIWELPIYVILGVVCAFVSVAFTVVLYRFVDFFERLPFPEYLKPCCGGLLVGAIGLIFPHVLGVGYEAIDLTLTQQLSSSLMLLLLLSKIIATSISVGSGGSGGIFAPALFLGAMTGGGFGRMAHAIFPQTTASTGAYSIVGMGAVVSGTIHGPLSAILIPFEMTGDYKTILPLMIACVVSYLVSSQMVKESIYTIKLTKRGINIKAGKEINVLKSISVEEVMNTHVETIPEHLDLGKLAEKISKSKYNSFPVINKSGKLTGILSFFDYKDALFNENLTDLVLAKDLASEKVVVVSTVDNLYDALQKITLKDFSILPVVQRGDETRLKGVISRRDIIGAYNKAVMKQSLFNR